MLGGNPDQNNPLSPHQTSMVRPQDNGEPGGTVQAEHQEQREQKGQPVQQRHENRPDHPPERLKP